METLDAEVALLLDAFVSVVADPTSADAPSTVPSAALQPTNPAMSNAAAEPLAEIPAVHSTIPPAVVQFHPSGAVVDCHCTPAGSTTESVTSVAVSSTFDTLTCAVHVPPASTGDGEFAVTARSVVGRKYPTAAS